MFMDSLWDGIDGIVLDAVGTLIEPEPSVAEVYLTVARRHGVDLSREEVRARFHRHFRQDEQDDTLGPMQTDEAYEERRWRRIVSRVLPEVTDGEEAFGSLWAHFGRPAAWRCFPDVSPTIQTLHSWGMRVCIGSNFDARLRAVVAGLPELSSLSSSLAISSEVGLRKPHPDFYRSACKHMGLATEQVLCVGDDPENDVLGPRRAGLRGVLLDRSGSSVFSPTVSPAFPSLEAFIASRRG
jgi:putative hydrolase of the HAD superfamily